MPLVIRNVNWEQQYQINSVYKREVLHIQNCTQNDLANEIG